MLLENPAPGFRQLKAQYIFLLIRTNESIKFSEDLK